MGRIAEWWRLRRCRKKERFVERNARQEYALAGRNVASLFTEELPRWPLVLFGAVHSIDLEPAWAAEARQRRRLADEQT